MATGKLDQLRCSNRVAVVVDAHLRATGIASHVDLADSAVRDHVLTKSLEDAFFVLLSRKQVVERELNRAAAAFCGARLWRAWRTRLGLSVVMTSMVITRVIVTGMIVTGVVMTGVVMTGVIVTGVIVPRVVVPRVIVTGMIMLRVVVPGVAAFGAAVVLVTHTFL